MRPLSVLAVAGDEELPVHWCYAGAWICDESPPPGQSAVKLGARFRMEVTCPKCLRELAAQGYVICAPAAENPSIVLGAD